MAHFYQRFNDLQRAQGLLADLTPAMVGLILGATTVLAPSAIRGWPGVAPVVLALALLLGLCWQSALALALGATAEGTGLIR